MERNSVNHYEIWMVGWWLTDQPIVGPTIRPPFNMAQLAKTRYIYSSVDLKIQPESLFSYCGKRRGSSNHFPRQLARTWCDIILCIWMADPISFTTCENITQPTHKLYRAHKHVWCVCDMTSAWQYTSSVLRSHSSSIIFVCWKFLYVFAWRCQGCTATLHHIPISSHRIPIRAAFLAFPISPTSFCIYASDSNERNSKSSWMSDKMVGS